MVVQHNLMAMNANRMFGVNTKARAKSTEKLSSGYRINRAADDAAGLAISEKMRRQIRGLTQAQTNVQDGVSFVQTAEGALNEVHDMLQRMNELAVKSANDTNSDDDRRSIDSEVQQLKTEIDRVLGTTTFNEKLIWDPNAEGTKIIGYENTYAVRMNSSSTSFDVSNANIGPFASSPITVHASEANGISFSWTGYDGKAYKTGSMSLDDLKAKNYSVKLSELYGSATADGAPVSLYNADGSPLFDATLSFKVAGVATNADIAKGLNNYTLSTSAFVAMTPEMETSHPFSFSGIRLNTAVAYQSFISGATDSFSFDAGNDNVIKPNPETGGNMTSYPTATTVSEARNDTNAWKFSFTMQGVGVVTGTVDYANYRCNDTDSDGEGIWWNWVKTTNGQYRSVISRIISPTLSGVMDALTGSSSDTTPGLLTEANGGVAKSGGTITFSMSLSAGGKSVGTQGFTLSISSSDTEDSIFEKIKNALNSSTSLDYNITDSNVNNRSSYISNSSSKRNVIPQPVYQATNDFFVQSGSESDNQIHIRYDSLSTSVLGINDLYTDTREDSLDAIDLVKDAMEIVSEQRSNFGAYQNRLEHTIANLGNVVENTTAAESQIRDTDMAKEMVSYSILNILEQAGISVMTQANQANQAILSLLQ